MTPVVFTKEQCVGCDATKRKFAKYDNLEVTYKAALEPENFEYISTLGHRQAPVVIVLDPSGEIVDHWSGYRPNKIEEHFGK